MIGVAPYLSREGIEGGAMFSRVSEHLGSRKQMTLNPHLSYGMEQNCRSSSLNPIAPFGLGGGRSGRREGLLSLQE